MSHTKYIWDIETDTVVMETDENNTVTAVYTNKPQQFGGLISQRRGSTTSYYHYDAIGSTERLTDASQTTTDTYVYSAFGEDKGATGTTVNPFRYVGKLGYYYDGAGLGYWVRERRYEPPVSRWLSIDPLRADFNLYRYVANNPLLLVDPTGLTKCCIEGKVVPLFIVCIRCEPDHCWIYAMNSETGEDHTYGRWKRGFGDAVDSGIQIDIEKTQGRTHECERCIELCGFVPTINKGYSLRQNNCATYADSEWERISCEDLDEGGCLWDSPETLCESILKQNGGNPSNVTPNGSMPVVTGPNGKGGCCSSSCCGSSSCSK